MTQEQKAQRYDGALERAREWYNDPHITIGLKGNLEDIFPELKESEDEKIRKELISLVLKVMGREKDNLNDEKYDKMLDWLEKQGEKKTTAWSEEDKDYYDAIITKLEVMQDDAALTDNQMEFLKSLRPQKQWKPSDEQISALFKVIPTFCSSNPVFSLYNDLKKLKGE